MSQIFGAKIIQNCLKINATHSYTTIYYWDKKLKKRLNVLEADKIIQKAIDLMCLAQRMHFLQDMFQMTAIALLSVINHYHINGLHLFWDTLYM